MSRKIKLLILLATRDVGSPFSWLPKEIIVEIFKWIKSEYRLLYKIDQKIKPKVVGSFIYLNACREEKSIVININNTEQIIAASHFAIGDYYVIYDDRKNIIIETIDDKRYINCDKSAHMLTWHFGKVIDNKLLILGTNSECYYICNLVSGDTGVFKIKSYVNPSYLKINRGQIMFAGNYLTVRFFHDFGVSGVVSLVSRECGNWLPTCKKYKLPSSCSHSKFYKHRDIIIESSHGITNIWREI